MAPLGDVRPGEDNIKVRKSSFFTLCLLVVSREYGNILPVVNPYTIICIIYIEVIP